MMQWLLWKSIHHRGTEFAEVFFSSVVLGVLCASALKIVADPSFGGSAVSPIIGPRESL
jgi:hypothetical protein